MLTALQDLSPRCHSLKSLHINTLIPACWWVGWKTTGKRANCKEIAAFRSWRSLWGEPHSRLTEGNLRAVLAQREVKSLPSFLSSLSALFTLQSGGWGGVIAHETCLNSIKWPSSLCSPSYISHLPILLSSSRFSSTHLRWHVAGITGVFTGRRIHISKLLPCTQTFDLDFK